MILSFLLDVLGCDGAFKGYSRRRIENLVVLNPATVWCFIAVELEPHLRRARKSFHRVGLIKVHRHACLGLVCKRLQEACRAEGWELQANRLN